MLRVEGLRPEPKLVQAALAGEVGFRQWRSLIGPNQLVADQYDTAGIAFLTQRSRRLKTGLPRADNRNGRLRHQRPIRNDVIPEQAEIQGGRNAAVAPGP